MSFPKAIDDHSTDDLLLELDRRWMLIEENKCPYCEKNLTIHTCKYEGWLDDYHNSTEFWSWVKDFEGVKV